MKYHDNRQGFSLIEVLIVLMIVATLSVMAIAGYTQYRRVALLDFAADSIVAQIEELKDDTIHGDFGGDRYAEIKDAIENDEGLPSAQVSEAQCLGFYFGNSDNGEVYPVFFSQEFYGMKKWELGEFVYEGCPLFNLSDTESYIENEGFELDKSVTIVEIIHGDIKIPYENFVMRFVPPQGEIEVSYDGGGTFNIPKTENDTLSIVLKYGSQDEDKYKRIVNIDLISGNAVTAPYE